MVTSKAPNNKGLLMGRNIPKAQLGTKFKPLYTPKSDFMTAYNASGATSARPLPFVYRDLNLDPTITKSKFMPNVSSDVNTSANLGSGNNKTIGGSGHEKIIGGSGNELQTESRQMFNVRPFIDVANLALSNQKINQIKKTQLARKNMLYSTPQLSSRPVQDLSPEILAAQDKAVSNIRSEYAGSDPAMNLIAKNMVGANREKASDQFIAGRASNLVAERGRHDTEQRQNEQMAAETEMKNLDRSQDFADYKTGVETAALDAKSKQNANFLSQMNQNIGERAQYNLSADAMDLQNAHQRANDLIKLAGAETNNATKEQYMLDAKGILEGKTPVGYAARLIPRYGQAQANAFSPNFLNRLFGSRYKR